MKSLGYSFSGHGRFARRDRRSDVLSQISFTVRPGEILGLAGESGAGKSTLTRLLVGIPPPQSGSVIFEGIDVARASRRQLREVWKGVQLIFQDPVTSLNPKWTVADIVSEPLMRSNRLARARRGECIRDAVAKVGLDYSIFAKRRPCQLSAGECQRVAIARALVVNPRLLICDEVVSALDPLTKIQIADLLQALRDQFNLAMVFVSHEIALLNRLSDRIAILRAGRLCEIGPAQSVIRNPRHPYTKLLIESNRRAQLPATTVTHDGTRFGTDSIDRRRQVAVNHMLEAEISAEPHSAAEGL